MKRTGIAAALILVADTPARADPIFTPIFVAIFTAAGLTGTTLTIAATIASAILTTAIGIGLSLLFSPRPPKPPTPENGAVAVQQAVPYSIYAFGTCRLSGSIMLKEEVAGNLVYVAALARQKFIRITGMFLNDDAVTVPTSGNQLFGYVAAGADGRYRSNYIFMDTRLGLPTETAYTYIANSAPSVWGSSFRGDGIASVSMQCLAPAANVFAGIYPYQAPAPSVVADTLAIFDPRDVTQSWNNPATWLFSKNAALNILFFECFSPFGARRNYLTAVFPVLSFWIQAANDCDDAMPLKAGGTEPRYQLGFWITTEQDRRATRQTMLTACDGHFLERGDGTIVLRVGKYAAPTVILTDADIVGWRVDRGKASDDTINQATARYTSPQNNYSTVETTPLFNAADQAIRPGPAKTAQLDLVAVQSTGQTSRLLKREMSRQNEKTRGSLTIRLSGMNAGYERWILVNSNTVPRLNGVVIENRKPVISLASQTMTIDFVSSGPQIDTYNPATEESAPPIVPQRPATVGLPIPANVTAIAEQITDASGSSTIFLDVSWDQPLYNGNPWNLNYQVQTRIHDIGGGTPGAWTQQTFNSPTIAGGRVDVATATVLAGTILDVQVSSIATGQTLSTGSTIVQVNTSIATTAPGTPGGLAATGGVGSASLSCTNPNSANFSAVQFYRASHGGSFATATAIGGLRYGAPSGTSTYGDTVAAGTWDYFATAQNSSGVLSSPAGPVVATVT